MNSLRLWGAHYLTYEPGTEKGWFLEWVLRSPKSAGLHLQAGLACMHRIASVGIEVDSVYEAFGGIGGNAIAAEEIFAPRRHRVNEFSGKAALFLRNNMPQNVDVREGDAYAGLPPYYTTGLVILDFGDLTVYRTREGMKQRALMDEVLDPMYGIRPKVVMVTDIASRYLHLHRERYEKLLGPGTCESYTTYLIALQNRIEDLYGYKMLVGYTHGWSTVMAFTRPNIHAKQHGFTLLEPADSVIQILEGGAR